MTWVNVAAFAVGEVAASTKLTQIRDNLITVTRSLNVDASRIQSGAFSVTDAAGNGSSVALTFPVAFATTPLVFLTVEDISVPTGGIEPFLSARSRTASGCEIQHWNPNSSSMTYLIAWLAVGT